MLGAVVLGASAGVGALAEAVVWLGTVADEQALASNTAAVPLPSVRKMRRLTNDIPDAPFSLLAILIA